MNATADLKPPVEFPVPDFTGLDAAFGAERKHYLTREQLGKWGDLGMRTPFHNAASQLFYKGGKLADHGLEIKPGIDRAKVHTALRALLGSFDPPHEIKIGTVAVALANWCDASKAA